MNFLAHLLLAGDEPEAIKGALLGDFVKGRLDKIKPAELRHGIMLHRKIDVFTDAHALTLISRNRFSGNLRRYAGIVVDLAYDHFLATKWTSYCQTPLADFTTKVYRVLLAHRSSFEGRSLTVMERMTEQDWLGSYVSRENVGSALAAISRRLSRPNPLARCELQLANAYAGLEEDFASFFPELVAYVAQTQAGRTLTSSQTQA